MSVLWNDGGIVSAKLAKPARQSTALGAAIEGSTQTHEAMMALGSKLLLESMMTAPRARK